MRVAKDVVVCLDAKTGKRRKTEAPASRPAASRRALLRADGRLFAAGSTHVYCMDAKSASGSGRRHYPSEGKGPASSSVDDGRLFLIAGQLTAYDAKSGELLGK